MLLVGIARVNIYVFINVNVNDGEYALAPMKERIMMNRHRNFASKMVSIAASVAMLVTCFAVTGNANAENTAGGGLLPVAKKLLIM